MVIWFVSFIEMALLSSFCFLNMKLINESNLPTRSILSGQELICVFIICDFD
jgi:hypothetical protein